MIKSFHTAVLCLIIISSCTTGSITFQNLYTSIKPIVNPDKSIPDEYNEDFPYAYASVRVGRGQIIYVVLSEADNKVLRWISNDGFEIKTINGKIIASNGLEKNISFLNANHELALSNIKEMKYESKNSILGLKGLKSSKVSKINCFLCLHEDSVEACNSDHQYQGLL